MIQHFLWVALAALSLPDRANEPGSYGSGRLLSPSDRTDDGYKSKRSPPSAKNMQLVPSCFSLGSQVKAWGSEGTPCASRKKRGFTGVLGAGEKSDERH